MQGVINLKKWYSRKVPLLVVFLIQGLSFKYLRDRCPYPFIYLDSWKSLFFNISERKQPTFCDTTTGFPAKWRLRNERRNSILMTRHFPDVGSASYLLKICSTNQKHYPDLGSVTSSVWNFSARFSDVISQGNQWWCHKMSAVFSQI